MPYLPSYPTGGEEHNGTLADTVSHQGNALHWVCFTGDKLHTPSSTSYLWIENPLPLCKQNLSFCPLASALSLQVQLLQTHTQDFWGKYLNRK